MQSSDSHFQLTNIRNPERRLEGFDADDMSKLTDFFSILIRIDQRSKKVTNEKKHKNTLT
ncbi:MAG: hypothetical protein A3J60_02175 [Candidatus Pacebacteria bacterium RIFCSPHIGHO2_02_FULL_46_9]|nr:MAG: hypothetical protein A3J60_02175 [Candidatus Pacebacteria bacterium RIFCSPHIGHO2_02_FULL_46_9]